MGFQPMLNDLRALALTNSIDPTRAQRSFRSNPRNLFRIFEDRERRV